MHLYVLPLLFILAGLALYTILGGADFGAGVWQLFSLLTPDRPGTARAQAEHLREHTHHAIGPVWEANHVWLIFVLTVSWTAYPGAFSAIASTLALPLLIAAVGIVFRGLGYALRTVPTGNRALRRIDGLFSVASVLTPFALGTIVGAIASGRVPRGNAAGSLISSWLNPTSVLVGVLFIVVSAYLAAVYLAADARRVGASHLAEAFRTRALVAAVAAGAVAIVGLFVLHGDAHRLYARLLSGPGIVGVALSGTGGLATVGLVLARRFGAARLSAAVAVVGLITGWALAQQPELLPGLSLHAAAASSSTQIAVIIAVAMGGIIIFPSLGVLFGLFLRGRFDGAERDFELVVSESGRRLPASLIRRCAGAGLLGGVVFLTLLDPPWAHIIGVTCLIACAVFTFMALEPGEEALQSPSV
ncbi:MAG TPA: cytochrome d ubiquinol oxidase subunit II [Solirubrobacteraceae bacterium]|nr:cytochrome d ubiquinol oxidase subunit II [Solirubrobacteraceae bacterium]